MKMIYETDLTDLRQLDVQATAVDVVTWRGRKALHLNGLAVLRGLEATDATVEVDVCAEGSCYPGIAFRLGDALNFELAYAVPHCSGLWDALQYDPVFHGSNTWQLYHGEPYQKTATVPTGQWFRLRLDVQGQRAAVSVNGQPPLLVPQLAHRPSSGLVGIWTYQSAYFSNLRLLPPQPIPDPDLEETLSPGTLTEWFVDGFGRVACEPSGVLNLNRYLPASLGQVTLRRHFELPAADEVELAFGFSDELSLAVDGGVVFSGTNTFKGLDSYEERGYVDLNAHAVHLPLEPGLHNLAATLKVTEGFGWGMILALSGEGIQLLPAFKG